MNLDDIEILVANRAQDRQQHGEEVCHGSRPSGTVRQARTPGTLQTLTPAESAFVLSLPTAGTIAGAEGRGCPATAPPTSCSCVVTTTGSSTTPPGRSGSTPTTAGPRSSHHRKPGTHPHRRGSDNDPRE
jgi:hypothetical protein